MISNSAKPYIGFGLIQGCNTDRLYITQNNENYFKTDSEPIVKLRLALYCTAHLISSHSSGCHYQQYKHHTSIQHLLQYLQNHRKICPPLVMHIGIPCKYSLFAETLYAIKFT